MSDGWSTVGKGCVIGCAVVVAVVVAVGVGGYLFVRDTAGGLQTAAETRHQLEQRFGRSRDFVAPAVGAPTADRLEVFLAVREAMAPQRSKVESALAALDAGPGEGPAAGLRAARVGFGLATGLGELLTARNQALLEQGMGPGEFTWLTALAFAPQLRATFEPAPRAAEATPEGSVTVRMEGDLGFDDARRELHRSIRTMIRNRLDAESPDELQPAWRAALEAELAALDADPGRLPWADGVPAEVDEALAPSRDRLDATFAPHAAPLELVEVSR